MTTRELKDSTSLASTTAFGVAKLAADGVTTAGLAVQGSDARLTAAADLAAHLADTGDAHDASAISFVPAGSIAATTVQAAIEEVASEASGDVAGAIHAATGKTTPVDADELGIVDSAASNVLKKLTWANLKATAKTYFDGIYATLTHAHAAADITSGTIAQARLGSGSGGAGTKVLYDDQTYKTPATGYSDPLTTRGDILYRDASATTRKALGSAGQRLASDGTDLVYVDDYAALVHLVTDGTGSALTTGLKRPYLVVPFVCTIVEARLLANASGSVVLDVFKCTYAQFDAGATHPVSGDKITSSTPPTITSATKSQDTTLSGWTTTLSAGDILAFNVNSATTIQEVSVYLRVKKS